MDPVVSLQDVVLCKVFDWESLSETSVEPQA